MTTTAQRLDITLTRNYHVKYRPSGPVRNRWKLYTKGGKLVGKFQCLEAASRHADSLERIGS